MVHMGTGTQCKASLYTPPACTSEVAMMLIEAQSLDSMSACTMPYSPTVNHDLGLCVFYIHDRQVHIPTGFSSSRSYYEHLY